MKPRLQTSLAQHLVMTPQLQQAIRLLQMSAVELEAELVNAVESNPLLDWTEAAIGTGHDEVAPGEPGRDDHHDAHDSSLDTPAPPEADWGGNDGDTWYQRVGPGDPGDDGSPADQVAETDTLHDHLLWQLHLSPLSPRDRQIAVALIESIDDNGYLHESLESIAATLGDDLHASCEEIHTALCQIQRFDPVGVGARDLAECLTLQLRTGPDVPARALAIDICRQHLDLLAKREFKKLSAATGADEPALRAARELIVHCDPKPGRAFGRNESTAVVPDVIVHKAGRAWKVQLNPDVMPKLRINDLYAQAIRGQRNGTGAGLNARLQEARWFVKNIQQRFDTIVRVSQAIVERQKGFFTHGAIAMKPLVLREIADELGLHESTISRVTTAKYMSTPFGTVELKYFFGSALGTETGGNASSTAVRALIKQFVSSESIKKPLSDSQISEMLKEQGIECARRTVAKYREALRIAPANLRKAL